MNSNTNSSAMGPMMVALDDEKVDLDGNARSASAEINAEPADDRSEEPTSNSNMEPRTHSYPPLPQYIRELSTDKWKSFKEGMGIIL